MVIGSYIKHLQSNYVLLSSEHMYVLNIFVHSKYCQNYYVNFTINKKISWYLI